LGRFGRGSFGHLFFSLGKMPKGRPKQKPCYLNTFIALLLTLFFSILPDNITNFSLSHLTPKSGACGLVWLPGTTAVDPSDVSTSWAMVPVGMTMIFDTRFFF
jgi:hypothetical protein